MTREKYIKKVTCTHLLVKVGVGGLAGITSDMQAAMIGKATLCSYIRNTLRTPAKLIVFLFNVTLEMTIPISSHNGK